MSNKLELFGKIENGEINPHELSLEKLKNRGFENPYMDLLESKILFSELKGDSFKETFERTLSKELGFEKTVEIKTLNSKERELQAEKFTQSVSSVSGTVQGGLQATMLYPLLDKYFYDNSIMNEVTLADMDANSLTVTDLTNERVGNSSDELATTTGTDNTTLADTITPNIRVWDKHEVSRYFLEVEGASAQAIRLAKMVRGVKNRIENMIIGDSGASTNGANQFWSIMNNQPNTGSNRGSIALTLPLSNQIRNHVDAVNFAVSQLPVFDASDFSKQNAFCNSRTAFKIMRTLDANNQYYFDMTSKSTKNLLTGGGFRIVNALPDDVVLVGDIKNYILKMLRMPRIGIFEKSSESIEIFMDTYADGTPSMAYKANSNKNGFRHFTLKTDYNV